MVQGSLEIGSGKLENPDIAMPFPVASFATEIRTAGVGWSRHVATLPQDQ